MPTKPFEGVFDVQLQAAGLRTTVEAAIQSASGVHRIDDAAEPIIVSSHPSMTQLGLYAHENGGRPVAILVNEQAPDPGLTFLHEVGHYLDQHALGASTYASVTPELDSWRDVVLGSRAIADLIAHWLTPPEPSDPALSATVAASVRAHVEYLLGPRELFARAYSQYIAVRSGSRSLLTELAQALRPNYREQWEDSDFTPIADHLDALFDQLGWR